MAVVDDAVAENYRRLRAERGLSWEQLAAQLSTRDRTLAAWLREQAAAEGETTRPKRHAPPKQTAEE